MLAGEASVSGDVATTTTTAATATATVAAQNEGGGTAAASAAAAGIFGGSNSGEDDKSNNRVLLDEAERAFGGNRWPRQETLALLEIRSDMDVAFRDASVKGPLWDDVSRKLGELGYNRSAKKCKEKFENVSKYHKRTKDGRTSKGQGKTYRFFEQLEAFQHHHPSLHQSPSPSPKSQAPAAAAAAVSLAMPILANPPPAISTVPSTTTTQIASTTVPAFPSSTNPSNHPSQSNIIPSAFHNISSTDLVSNWTSSSSSTSSDLELEAAGRRRKRKRKWRDFLERLMKEVVDKQEELQKKLLEAIEKREHERMVREEAWRMQEMTRISREREILSQERSIAAAKDAAVMSFLQKLAEQQNPPGSSSNSGQVTISNNIISQILPQPTPDPAPAPIQTQPPPPPPPPPPKPQPQPVFSMEIMKRDNNGERNYHMAAAASSSRWPKIEVEALIKLRTDLDSKYQENGPKGPLWEEISAGMRRLGYNRNSKRCKEKWENINKYFKKVKESNKKRPEDSKTCPYFHQLDALYKEKNKHDHSSAAASNPLLLFKPDHHENSEPLMVEPEQQWPPPQQLPEHQQQQQQDDDDEAMEDDDTESDQNNIEEDDKDGDDDEEDDDDGGDFEIVANKSK